ncbi:MAG: hypothetical protein IKI94_07910 [Ruminococcus sp.]|nr:hypothetical protein [Ruminococcus sp.]
MKKTVIKIIFIANFIINLAGFVVSFPKYIHLKFLYSTNFDLWLKIHALLLEGNYGLRTYYRFMRDNLPDSFILLAIILNIINMIFGFVNYKTKWWYYVILIITVIMSIMLWDCFYILIHQDDMA